MTPERWQAARKLFDGCLDMAPEERSLFLQNACEEDGELRGMVQSLLDAEADSGATTWLDGSASESLVARAMQGESLEGRRIGDFIVREVLGSGGMATVFVADQQHPKRSVALKVMRFGFASDAARRRFDYESEILASLQHPGIAQVYATGTYRDAMSGQELPYFAMELVEGAHPLHEHVATARLDATTTLRLFVEVCRAVQHGHARGFLHRDLKPQNILVDGQGRPKIIDFGIARAAGPEHDGEAMRTLEGEILGTLHYMSPEQVDLDARELDVRADVYSLGVVLFELVTGRLPFQFEGRPITAAIETIRREDPPRPSSVGSRFAALDEDLDLVILTALDKDRERRYGSAAALADDLERFLAHEPVRARPPSRGYLLRKFVRRNRTAVAAASLLFVSLVAGITATTVNLFRAWDAERQVREALEQVKLEAEMSKAVNNFLLNTLKSPTPHTDGREVKVVDMLDKVVDESDTLYTDRPVFTGALKQTLGTTYLGLGQAKKALPLLERATELGQEHLPRGHFQAVRAMISLVSCYMDLARFEDAAQVAERAYADQRAAHQEPNKDTAKVLYVMGLLDYRMDEFERAVERTQEALEVFERVLEPGSREIIQVTAALGQMLTDAGRDKEGERAMRKSIELGVKHLGPDDPSTIIAKQNLGTFFMKLSRYDDALQAFTDAIEPHERIFGKNHVETLLVVNNLASAQHRTGRSAEAVATYRDLLRRRKAVGKWLHPTTAIALNNLGISLEGSDQLKEAVVEFEGALAMLEQLRIPKRHWLTAVCRKGLAVVHRKMRRFPEAESTLRECIAIFEASKGDQRRRIRRALQALADVYDDWGKPADAEKVRQRLAAR